MHSCFHICFNIEQLFHSFLKTDDPSVLYVTPTNFINLVTYKREENVVNAFIECEEIKD